VAKERCNLNPDRPPEDAKGVSTPVASSTGQKPAGECRSLADALSMPEAAEIEFEPSRLGGELFRPADLT